MAKCNMCNCNCNAKCNMCNAYKRSRKRRKYKALRRIITWHNVADVALVAVADVALVAVWRVSKNDDRAAG